MNFRILLSVALVGGAFGFTACSSDEDGDAANDADAGASSSSSSSGAASSSSGGSSSGGSSSSSSSSSSGDAGSDAGTCSQEAQSSITEIFMNAAGEATDLNENDCASDVTQVQIAEQVQQAIERCEVARVQYADDANNAPIREALAGTLTDGLLRGQTLPEAMIGATIHAVSQGVGPAPFQLTFAAGGVVTSHECTFDGDVECNDREGTYVLTETAPAGTYSLTLDFPNAPLTPEAFVVTPDEDLDVPAYRFDVDGEPTNTAYTFEDRCSA